VRRIRPQLTGAKTQIDRASEIVGAMSDRVRSHLDEIAALLKAAGEQGGDAEQGAAAERGGDAEPGGAVAAGAAPPAADRPPADGALTLGL
jgi:hypothetical protein